MNTAEVTAAPLPVVLGGKTYLCSPFCDEDFGVFERFAQDKYLDIAFRNVDKLKDQACKDRLIDKAYEESIRVTFTSAEGMRQMATPKGMVLLVWLSLRKNHPEETLDTISELLSKPSNAKELTKAVNKLVPRAKKKKTPKGPIPTKRVSTKP